MEAIYLRWLGEAHNKRPNYPEYKLICQYKVRLHLTGKTRNSTLMLQALSNQLKILVPARRGQMAEIPGGK